MNLQFTNKGGNFVSEFEVTLDFNLHIEGVRLSDMHIYQKTAGGSYAKVTDFPSERSQDRVADFDFASLVYPKFIKVVCATEPTYAEIATDGEVTEIKSQSKEVEIVSNGVTEIAPDAGFGYLSGVKVNVNVPQSGGGDTPSQPSGGWNLAYYKIDHSNSNAAMMIEVVMFYASPHLVNVAYEANSGKLLINGGVAASTLIADNVKAVVIADLKVCSGDKCEMSVFTDTLNALKDNMGAQIDMSVFIPITEEEYYNPATYA